MPSALPHKGSMDFFVNDTISFLCYYLDKLGETHENIPKIMIKKYLRYKSYFSRRLNCSDIQIGSIANGCSIVG